MNRDALCYESTVSLARRIRAGEVSPSQAVNAYLERIERVDPRVHSYLHVAADHALQAARRAEQALATGRELGALHGVPLAVKDLFDTAGIPTTCGSPRIFGGNVPTRNATAVERLEQAGAVLLGKLHMTEFAFIAHHPDTGPARNPWAADRSPGGSSSGSAVAAAAGLASATLGTDTAASIRLPAAWCGAVGLKPTWGRVSRDGVFPLAASLDHVGPITRSVADAALVLHCIAGPDPRDPSTRRQGAPPAEPAPRDDFKGVRIGWDEDYVTMGVLPEVVEGVRAARDRMEALGATIVPVELPDMETTVTTFTSVFDVEMRAAHAGLYPDRAPDYGPLARHALARFSTRDPLIHVGGAIEARAFRQRVDQLFDEIDVLLCPVSSITAPPQVDDETIVAIFADDHRNIIRLTRLTSFWDLAATPAIALPWGFDRDGLPLAVQLVTRVGTDEALLSIAARLEAEAPDRGRRPPLNRPRPTGANGGIERRPGRHRARFRYTTQGREQRMTTIDEVAPDVFRISTYVPEANLQFGQFLVRDEEPLLFETGMRALFPAVRDAVAKVIDPTTVRWVSFSHFEADECGSLNEWLTLAPGAQAACSLVGSVVSVDDFALRPARQLADDEAFTTGRRRFRFLHTPHVPHCWEAGMLFEETERTLLCTDLLQQNGERPPLGGPELLGLCRESLVDYQKGPFANYLPYTRHTGPTLERLAALQPRTLATMHGSVFQGDGAGVLRDLGRVFAEVLG